MIQELRNRVDILLDNVKDNELLFTKLTIIKKILSDEKCFFKMPIDDAYNILLDLNYTKDEALNIYKQLVSFEEFNN